MAPGPGPGRRPREGEGRRGGKEGRGRGGGLARSQYGSNFKGEGIVPGLDEGLGGGPHPKADQGPGHSGRFAFRLGQDPGPSFGGAGGARGFRGPPGCVWVRFRPAFGGAAEPGQPGGLGFGVGAGVGVVVSPEIPSPSAPALDRPSMRAGLKFARVRGAQGPPFS